MGALRDSDRYEEKTDVKSVTARSMIRRMVVGLTNAALWALEATADEKDTDVEVFPNAGFYSRPPDAAEAEVIVVKVGASTRHAVVIASRDEETRQAVPEAKALAADEAIVYNSAAVVYLKADGTIEIKSAGGTALPLVTKAEFDAHLHPTGVGPSGIPSNAPIVGTTVLKAE